MVFEARLTRKTLVLPLGHRGRVSHPMDTPLGSDVSTVEPLICIASCLVIGKLPQPVRAPHGRLMQVTRSLETRWGRPFGCRSVCCCAYGRGHGRVLGNAARRALERSSFLLSSNTTDDGIHHLPLN